MFCILLHKIWKYIGISTIVVTKELRHENNNLHQQP